LVLSDIIPQLSYKPS